MKTIINKKSLSLVLCLLLIAAMAFLAACNGTENTSSTSAEQPEDVTDNAPEASAAEESKEESPTESEVGAVHLGSGETEFCFTVTDLEGNRSEFVISTDKTTVGDALIENDLIAGEDSAYGLYVKTVNGTTLDYDTDGHYWAFYIGGEYASTGVDSTDIVAGESYEFKAE